MRRRRSLVALLALALLTAACTMGPRTVIRDRFDYSAPNSTSSSHGCAGSTSRKEPPADALVAVPYRGHWYWIDDRDIVSKRIFSFIMFIFTLVEPGSKEPAPVLTIPTG